VLDRLLNCYARELGHEVPDGPPNSPEKPSTFFVKTDAEIPYDNAVRFAGASNQYGL
jgi:hypothetical protein